MLGRGGADGDCKKQKLQHCSYPNQWRIPATTTRLPTKACTTTSTGRGPPRVQEVMCARTVARTAFARMFWRCCPTHAVLLLLLLLRLLLWAALLQVLFPWAVLLLRLLALLPLLWAGLLQVLFPWAVLLLRLLALLPLLWAALMQPTMPPRALLRCSRTTATEWLQQLARPLLRFTH